MTLTATHHPLVLPGTDGAATTPSVVFSFGMGVDSVALILRWLEEPASRDFDLAGLVMITAQVGDEFDSTRRLVEDHVLPRLRRAGGRPTHPVRPVATQDHRRWGRRCGP